MCRRYKYFRFVKITDIKINNNSYNNDKIFYLIRDDDYIKKYKFEMHLQELNNIHKYFLLIFA